MESKVEAVLAGKKTSFPADMEEQKDAMASSATASPAGIFAFLAPPLSLLRHVACLSAGYLGLGGGLKPPAPAPASSPSSSAAAAATAACQIDEVKAPAASQDYTEVEVVLEVRSRGGAKPPKKPTFKPPRKTRELPVQSQKGGSGGETSP